MTFHSASASLKTIDGIFIVLLSAPGLALAHCDGLDGPVVKAAEQALATGNLNLVLVWVQRDDEPEIQRAFNQALAVRKLNSEARELADRYFFETVVRVHRAGEGEPYTGLQPAGRDLGPAIPAADRALETGSAEPVVQMLTAAVSRGIRERFERARVSSPFNADDVAAGREHVKVYVEYVHYVEGLQEAAHGAPFPTQNAGAAKHPAH